MILCIGTTPAAQRVMVFRSLALDSVNRAVTALDSAAGKSINVAKVLKVLGEEPLAVGFLGGKRGSAVRAALAALGIDNEFVTVTAQTRLCTTLLDQAAGTVTELVEEGQPVSASDYEALMRIVQRRTQSGCRAVIMSGTVTPGGPTDLYFRGTEAAHETGALAVVDARDTPLTEALKAKPDLVKPNRSELAATLGRELKDEAAVLAGMRELAERGAKRVVVTAGSAPTLAFDGRSCWRIHPPKIKATNPIGSGDAFTAGVMWRLLRGGDLGEASRWAAAVGAANALTLMPGDVRREDVERLAKEVTVDQL